MPDPSIPGVLGVRLRLCPAQVPMRVRCGWCGRFVAVGRWFAWALVGGDGVVQFCVPCLDADDGSIGAWVAAGCPESSGRSGP